MFAISHMQPAVFSTSEKAHDIFYSGEKQQQHKQQH